MLSGDNSLSVYKKSNMALWMLMAFQAGALNVGGLLACHTFVSHTTGFASLAALQLEKSWNISSSLSFLSVPLFFLVGSMWGGLLADLPLQMNKQPKFHVLFGILFGLISLTLYLGVEGSFGEFGTPLNWGKDYGLVALLCLACGLQNGAVTSVSKSVIRTTHLTGITTDLGIGFVRVLNRGKIPSSVADESSRANKMRIGIILAFTLGSFLGSYFYIEFQYKGFVLPLATTAILFAITLYHFKIKPLISK